VQRPQSCFCGRKSAMTSLCRTCDNHCSFHEGDDHAESGINRFAPARDRRSRRFSGAGLSADSGIPTFRDGATGLWNNVDPDEVASIEGFLRNPQRAWSWLLQLRNLVDERHPNAGHHAIARLDEICSAQQFTVITQNIDGYHARAGNRNVLEVHGTIHRVRCHRHCGFVASWDQSSLSNRYACPACGAPVRPDLVMFGEMLDEAVFAAAEISSLEADVFFCVGTSFTVQPAARLPLWAKQAVPWWWKSIRTRRPCRSCRLLDSQWRVAVLRCTLRDSTRSARPLTRAVRPRPGDTESVGHMPCRGVDSLARLLQTFSHTQ
jgi:NAD-dependent deacetylase